MEQKKELDKKKSSFTKEQIMEIKQLIKSRETYASIAKKYNIKSISFISGINTGKYYYEKNEFYPLVIKGRADKSWIFPCLKSIIFEKTTLTEIAKKHNKAESTIKKLEQGRANKQSYLIYPLRQKIEENKKLFQKFYEENVVSTISG